MKWKYLGRRPKSQYRQLFIRGTRIMASSVVASMRGNNMTAEEIADDMGLSVEVVRECVKYCECRRAIIDKESEDDAVLLSFAK